MAKRTCSTGNGAERRGRRWLAAALLAAAAAPSAACAAEDGGGCSGGYRRSGELRDFTPGRSWVVLVNCAHPEMPAVAVGPIANPIADPGGGPKPGAPIAAGAARNPPEGNPPREPAGVAAAPGSAGFAPAARAVREGDRVRLWRRNSVARIDLAGVALGGGAAGAAVRVRVAPGGAVLRGTVRGPGSVELDRWQGSGFSGGSE
jgi:hypothetical protein